MSFTLRDDAFFHDKLPWGFLISLSLLRAQPPPPPLTPIPFFPLPRLREDLPVGPLCGDVVEKNLEILRADSAGILGVVSLEEKGEGTEEGVTRGTGLGRRGLSPLEVVHSALAAVLAIDGKALECPDGGVHPGPVHRVTDGTGVGEVGELGVEREGRREKR